MSFKLQCTTIEIKDGTASIYHLPYGGSVYDDECIWHNDKGPAMTTTTGKVGWWLHDDAMAFEAWCGMVTITEEELFILRMTYL